VLHALEQERFQYLSQHTANAAPRAALIRAHTPALVDQILGPLAEEAARETYVHIDADTVMSAGSAEAALTAAGAVIDAVDLVMAGDLRNAFCAVRPPGHHAERRAFGGFCYLNNAAIAAHFLSRYGRVAVLDIDYHHGNGTQDIFYARGDVLTVSIHGHPRFAYPYFTGFADETGMGEGEGCNLNLPLAEQASVEDWFRALKTALARIAKFAPHYLVVALGFAIAALGLASAFIQEGGYRTRTLGRNAGAFFSGVLA
jgi:acetoin utilization deacetylase AcuC-like enzyme